MSIEIPLFSSTWVKAYYANISQARMALGI